VVEVEVDLDMLNLVVQVGMQLVLLTFNLYLQLL
jgi:hypothetical protein